MSFGYRPHLCVGMHLARREMRIAMEEFLRLIPRFSVKPGHVVSRHLGMIQPVALRWSGNRPETENATMPKITYQQPDGTRRMLDVAAGVSVMKGAADNDVTGIRAECGGVCACATCMVSVDPEWQARLPPAAPMELPMLDDEVPADGMQARLSCQIKLTPELDGLVVHVPQAQF